MNNAAIYTGTDFAPWKIPHKAQGILINSYANKHGKQIDFVINEGIFFDSYSRMRSLMETRPVEELFFTSIFQLPQKNKLEDFLGMVDGKIIYFALEELYGDSEYLINVVYKNLELFRGAGSYKSKYEVIDFYKNI